MVSAGLRPDLIVRFGHGASVDASQEGLTLAQPDAFDELVRKFALPRPLWATSSAALEAVLVPQHPELAICACFSARIAPSVLDAVPLGVLNVHPSSLPAFRGPAPLFWQLRDGLSEVGLSIHRMVPQFDAGPVLVRETFVLEHGARLAHIEAALGQFAGRELAQLGATDLGPGEPQDELKATYQSWPTDRDHCLSPLWSAAHGYRFIRAMAAPDVVFRIQIMAQSFALERALSYESCGVMREAFVVDGTTITIRMNPGLLVAGLARSPLNRGTFRDSRRQD